MSRIIILLFALSLTDISAAESEYPQWPRGACTFTKYGGKTPLASGYYDHTFAWEEKDCEEECGDDERCGMYRYDASPAAFFCEFYQHSVRMWEEAGLPAEAMLSDDRWMNVGSKDCEAQVITVNECDDYVYEEGWQPSGDDLALLYTDGSESLTSEMCKAVCNLFSACNRVAFTGQSDGYRVCQLYPYSSRGEREECRATDSPCGTYKRECFSS